MLKTEEILQLRTSYIAIGKMVQKYGYGQYNGILSVLMGQVRCIDSDEEDDVKKRYLVESYSRLFGSKGSLGDFVIYDTNPQVRERLNVEYDNEVKQVWEIIKKYI